MILALVGELLLSSLIVLFVPYTEIDWRAYMQEVEGFLQGETQYDRLQGETGPLVYPAGFIYIFSLLYRLTASGRDIICAQWVFAALYVATQAFVLAIYRHAGDRVPLLATLLLTCSLRVHSIFMLRLFNDAVAMCLLYSAILLFLRHKWHIGCAVYSLAVGVKMNVLLFAPGLLLLLLQGQGIGGTVTCLAICAGMQLLLGMPFLLRDPVAYLRRSFDLGRVFDHKWTVNFRFLSEELFVSGYLAAGLLTAMVGALLLFAWKWLAASREVRSGGALAPSYAVKTLLVSNLIGVVFCRSLHYQFYVWYFHSLPFLLWETDLPVTLKLSVLAAVEYAFNIFPSTPESSLLLQAAHVLLLGSLFASPVRVAARSTKRQ
ncbi:unnamed protein product [Chrysoparadoxa australica]